MREKMQEKKKKREDKREEKIKQIMNKADQKNKLPQEGTSTATSTGESLTGALGMSSLPAIPRAPGRPTYSGGGQNSLNTPTGNTHLHTHTQTSTKGGAAAGEAADGTRTMETDDTGRHIHSEEGQSRLLSKAEYKENPFIRGGAVQRSPPMKSTGEAADVCIIKEVKSADQQAITVVSTGAYERKGSIGSIETHSNKVEGPLRESDLGIFARPLGKRMEKTYTSARESEADASDCSLASSSSTNSRTRKRRQPYISKPGKAKKTAVDDEEIRDPYECPPTTKAKKELPTVENIQNELKDCRTVDIMTRVMESMSGIEKVVDSSRNLRGAHEQSLRLAARFAIAAASQLAQRSSISDVEKLMKENSELRSEIANLKVKLANLTVEVESLHHGDAVMKESNQQQAGEPESDKNLLVQRISALMDEKLADFRTELLHQKVVQPTVDTSQPKDKKNRGKKKAPKETNQISQPVAKPSETPSLPPEYPKPEQSDDTWVKVVGRKARTSSSRKEEDATLSSAATLGRARKAVKTAFAPKSAAVTLTLTESATINYADAMVTAKQRVNLADCGISHVRQRKGITGGLVLEVHGPDSAKKADSLADHLRRALSDVDVRIARPVKTGELRIMDLDDSISKQDITQAIAEAGECPQENVKVGEIRYSASRLGTVWVRCPLTAIHKLAVEKYLRVGWVSARVRVLAARQLQCFRCLELGHVRKQCSNTVDRSLCCYICGEQGHKARECEAKVPKCPVCADLGRPADHRLGGLKCNPPKKARFRVPLESCQKGKTANSVNQPSEKAKETQNIPS